MKTVDDKTYLCSSCASVFDSIEACEAHEEVCWKCLPEMPSLKVGDIVIGPGYSGVMRVVRVQPDVVKRKHVVWCHSIYITDDGKIKDQLRVPIGTLERNLTFLCTRADMKKKITGFIKTLDRVKLLMGEGESVTSVYIYEGRLAATIQKDILDCTSNENKEVK